MRRKTAPTIVYIVTVENIAIGKKHIRRVTASSPKEAKAKACEEVGGINAGQYTARECKEETP